MPHLAYLSLGSNIGDREAHLREAVRRLESAGMVRSVSSIYETEPVEFKQQRAFLNLVAEAATELFPVMLLGDVVLVTRPLLLPAWLAFCAVLGRVINRLLADLHGHIAPGTHPYLRKPS